MGEMVERVGEALRTACKAEFGTSWSYDIAWTFARAAIEAMREPNDEMLTACWPNHHPWGKGAPAPEDRPNGFAAMKEKASADWRTMIDAALAEDKPNAS